MTDFQKEVGIAAVLCFFFCVFFLSAGIAHTEKETTGKQTAAAKAVFNESL